MRILACWGAIFVGCGISGPVHAVDCERVATEAEDKGAVIIPRAVFEVTGKGRLQFYSAPSLNCVMTGVFVVRGDSLISYVDFNQWMKIAYVRKDGEMIEGWVSDVSRLKYSGRIGVKE